jgi:hypothetical protein
MIATEEMFEVLMMADTVNQEVIYEDKNVRLGKQ